MCNVCKENDIIPFLGSLAPPGNDEGEEERGGTRRKNKRKKKNKNRDKNMGGKGNVF